MKNPESILLPRTFWWHNVTQFGGAMNDNLFKLLIVYAMIAWQGEEAAAGILAGVGLAFALPFLLIVPIAGNFADTFSKRNLIVWLKGAELGIMAFGVLSLFLQNSTMLYITMFFMASQSAFFGPCKYGILPEQVKNTALSKANGYIQLFTFLAIICGTALAPELSLFLKGNFSLAASLCLVIAGLGLLAAFQISKTPAAGDKTLRLNGFRTLYHTTCDIRKDGFLTLGVLALAVFSFAAAFIQLNILEYGAQHLDLTHEASTRLFLLTALGIGVGSTTAGWLSGRSIEFGIVPIGSALMASALLILGTMAHGNVFLASLSMLLLGFAAGLFIVPLESFIQYRSPGKQIGAIQAANSFYSWVGILLASSFLFLNSSVLQWTAQQGFFALSAIMLGLTVLSFRVLPDFFIKFIASVITRVCYRLQVRGLDNLPSDRAALLVCNHISLLDAVLVTSSQQRRVRILMSRSIYENSNWMVRKLVEISQVILIHTDDNPKKILQSLKSARTALDDGYLVCIFAEGALSRTGMMRPFKPGFERIVKGTEYPIIPVHIGGAWGTVASFRSGMPRLRPLADFRYPVSVCFGAALPSTSTAFEVRQAICECSVDSFEIVKQERHSLGYEFIKATRRNWHKSAITEITGKTSSCGELLTAAMLLRHRINQLSPSNEARVGILLPPGKASALANLALSLGRRTSVNLNYTAPPATVASAMKQCELRSVITSRAFLEKVAAPSLPENVIYMEDLASSFGKSEMKIAWVKARFFPARILLAERKFQPDDIATILFSSGSTAEPKGVQLSHHNLLSNIEAFRAVLSPKRNDVLLTALPFFHSFGYTATFWFPLLSGVSMVCHNNPLDASTIGALAETNHATILLTTPTFLLAYTRKVKPEQFSHLRYVFTGAEKLQPRVADLFEKRFGIRPMEGYGTTELSPVCALSLPNVTIDNLEETGNRDGWLGRTLPGIAMKILSTETGEPLPPGEEGMICVKGPNVMIGYLNRQDLTDSVLKNGWYHTGDIGKMDTDGFFTITGRLSRFSKIGGEMISHGAIETVLQDAFELNPDAVAIVAIEDDRKGEKLCVLHTSIELSESSIQEKLRELDVPNLWKPNPRDWKYIESLPMLGSGKLDYPTMRKAFASTASEVA